MQRVKTRYHLMLLVGALVVLLGRISVTRAQTCVPPPEGLVSWWPGEGDATDLVGGNDGTLEGGTTFASGFVGQAFRFDGVDDHVRIPDAENLDFTNALSIEAWVFPTEFPVTFPTIVGKWDAIGLEQRSYNFHLDSTGKVFFRASPNGEELGFEVGTVISTTSVPLNQWTHVAGVYDGSTMQVYLNGVLDNQVVYDQGIFAGPHDLSIGATVGGVAVGQFVAPFAGLIDEVSIYNRALSAAEIAAIFNAGSAGKCKTLQPCTLSLETQSTDGTLSLAFTLGTQEPATWNVWLTAQNEIVRLLSLPLAVTDPPVAVPFTLPFVPSLGTVGVLTTLITPDQGILCSEFATVDTGPVSEDAAASVHELQDVLLQHLGQ